MSDNVVMLPGGYIKSTDAALGDVLDGAAAASREEDWDSLVVVGRRRGNGKVELFSSSANIDEVVGLLQRGMIRAAKHDLLVQDDSE